MNIHIRVSALRRKPVGPLPAGNLAHHRAIVQQMRMERRAAHTARGRLLAVGKVVGIKQPKRLFRALEQVRACCPETAASG